MRSGILVGGGEPVSPNLSVVSSDTGTLRDEIEPTTGRRISPWHRPVPVRTLRRVATRKPDEHDEERRKLLKRGLIAAPLLVTLAARPVQAQAMGSLGAYGYGTETDDVCDPEDDPVDNGRGRGRGGSLSRGR